MEEQMFYLKNDSFVYKRWSNVF